MHARSLARRGGGEAQLVVQSFNLVPIQLKPDQLPCDSILLSFLQRRAPDKISFLKMHHLRESQFIGRKLLRRNQRPPRASVIDIQQKQSSLNPRNIERQHSRRMQVELAA